MEFLQEEKGYRIYPISEHAITMEWPSADDFEQVIRYEKALRAAKISGTIIDLVPAYNTLTIFFDPLKMDFNDIALLIQDIKVKSEDVNIAFAPRLITIPVCYGGTFGPDLEQAAAGKGLTQEAFIQLHTNQKYRVYMLGFLPGFPYMGWVDERISLPRLSMPRREVPAGSVGIAGLQTGIYPLNSPGGWPIIGRTPIKLFDADQHHPCLLQPGDEVRFVAITPEEFEKHAS